MAVSCGRARVWQEIERVCQPVDGLAFPDSRASDLTEAFTRSAR